ncbi:MAG: D-glycero-beta-D-manno-heptose 1-phosphate adenylyltransferase [Bacteroidales bacterium]|nr:D-glycero-beta-D-manno-heptose 1-phosphate adenylyltransferase [Bacteroidales bacterium]
MEKLELVKSRILSGEKLERQLAVWRFLGKKIVFTNGCFDILHLGHIDYLARAASMGDVLVIGINSDLSVRRIKGDQRPVIDQASRSMALAALRFVDAVVLFDEETPYELIRRIMPQVLVKGGDYHPEDIAGHDLIEASGGRIEIVDLVPGYSTSGIIDRIRKSN